MKTLFIYLFILLLRNIERPINHRCECTGNYLLLIAHPDDDSMFFAPTLLNIEGRIRIICLSKGDSENVRESEIKNLCKRYNYELTTYNFKDNDDWDTDKIVDVLELTYILNPFSTLITFDKFGVSGHKNHVSCYKAARKFNSVYKIRTMYLKSVNLFRKYIISSNYKYTVSWKNYFKPVQMMFMYPSQLLWFRYLYIMFSTYMVGNSYHE